MITEEQKNESTIQLRQSAKLWALLVGITYSNDEELESLPGCLNDLEDIKGYLETHLANNSSLKIIKEELREQEATRENIIAKFSLFDRAENGDICLFYFSGHGTQITAPEVFRDANGFHQALVCYRTKKPHEVPLIIDKELSYLIANVTQNKDVHFLVITDCCHSGSNTKSTRFLVKNAPSIFPAILFEQYHRHETYPSKVISGQLVVTPPRGSHIKLAASLDSQEAKQEINTYDHSAPRSIFTKALFKVLRDCGGKISYHNLICKVEAMINLMTSNQTPNMQVIGLPQEVRKSYFLDPSQNLEPPQVVFRKSSADDILANEWIMEAGHLHGIVEMDKLQIGEYIFSLIKVYDTFSRVELGLLASRNFKEDQIYFGRIIHQEQSPFVLDFAPDFEAERKKKIESVFEEQKSQIVSIKVGKHSPDLIIHDQANAFGLSYPDGYTYLCKRPYWNTPQEMRMAARILFLQSEAIAKYFKLIGLENPTPSLREDCITIQLERPETPYRYEEVTNYKLEIRPSEGAKESELPAQAENQTFPWYREQVFRYFYDDEYPGGPWFPPAFKLQLENKHQVPLWVSAFYCGSGYTERDLTPSSYLPGEADDPFYPFESLLFCASNRFLPPTLLLRGEKALMEDEFIPPGANQQIGTNLIELSILDDYFDHGWNEIKDVLKVFISENKFDGDLLNLDGLAINTERMTMSRKPPKSSRMPEGWRTYNLNFTIVKPRKLGMVDAAIPGSELKFGPLTIHGHHFFRAMVVLSTMEELIRTSRIGTKDILMARPEIFFYDNFPSFELISFSTGLGQIEGCSVIEFFLSKGKKNVSRDHPLKIELKADYAKGWSIKPIGYDNTERRYSILKHRKRSNTFLLYELPDVSPSLIPGLSSSIKIFFAATNLSSAKKKVK